jgi:hypothetical protein
MIKKKPNLDLVTLNHEVSKYFFPGYDLYFIHGWFCAYLSALGESEDDLLIPTYLVLNEGSIDNEQHFDGFIGRLVELYSALADQLYEHNKPLCPLIDLSMPQKFATQTLDDNDKPSLLNWLTGYLNGYLVIGEDITELKDVDEELMEKRFYPGLFTVCMSLLKLVQEVGCASLGGSARDNFNDVLEDARGMWSSEDGSAMVEQQIAAAIKKIDYNDLSAAVNDIFYVVRSCDEIRYNNPGSSKLLNNLVSRH